jgi:hypothetical protein
MRDPVVLTGVTGVLVTVALLVSLISVRGVPGVWIRRPHCA